MTCRASPCCEAPPPGSLAPVSDPVPFPHHHRQGMGTHRLHRLRGPPPTSRCSAHSASNERLAQPWRVRGRHRRREPAPGPRLHPAGHLLRLAAAGRQGCLGRRPLLHCARPGRHPGALGAVLRPMRPLWVRGPPPAPAPPWRRWRCRRRSASCPAAGGGPVVAAARARWVTYLVLGRLAAATVGPWLVLVLAACGLSRPRVRRPRRAGPARTASGARPVAVVALPRPGGSAPSPGSPSRWACSPTAAASSSFP